MYLWKVVSLGTCELFFYGGCGGNHNNFENKTDCETFCKVTKEDTQQNTTKSIFVVVEPFNKTACMTAPRHGSCHLNEPRWFFSHWDNICKPYNYSGCGGNFNNFISEEDCTRKCPSIPFDGSEPRCEKLRNRGQCSMKSERLGVYDLSLLRQSYIFLRYFFDNISKKCVKFGGCTDVSKDENNFESRQICSNICIEKR